MGVRKTPILLTTTARGQKGWGMEDDRLKGGGRKDCPGTNFSKGRGYGGIRGLSQEIER